MADRLDVLRDLGQSGVARPLLRQAQIDAERVVAKLRIVVSLGLFLTIFWVVSGTPLDGQPHIKRQLAIAILTLSGYTLLGIVSLGMLYRGWFRVWMVWIVATADCLFLFVNSWLSLMNSGLVGDYLFVMPSVWLTPIVLAFAVLRFNPAVQIYSVILIILGHGYLLGVVPVEQGNDTLAQLQSVLRRQPNIVRIAMIGLAGGILIVAALRTRRLLRQSISDAAQKAKLTRYLPSQVVGDLAIQEPDALRQGQEQQAAVLFVDIRGFTQWSEARAPEEVGAFVTEFRRRVERATKEHDGIIDKYIGDAAMVIFSGQDHASRGLVCAQDILREIADWSEVLEVADEAPVAVGIGLHRGKVFLGVVGTAERLEYTVLGDTVNVAARLQDASKEVGHALVASADVLEAAGLANAPARDGWTALPAIGLRGRAEGVALFGWDVVAPSQVPDA